MKVINLDVAKLQPYGNVYKAIIFTQGVKHNVINEINFEREIQVNDFRIIIMNTHSGMRIFWLCELKSCSIFKVFGLSQKVVELVTDLIQRALLASPIMPGNILVSPLFNREFVVTGSKFTEHKFQ